MLILAPGSVCMCSVWIVLYLLKDIVLSKLKKSVVEILFHLAAPPADDHYRRMGRFEKLALLSPTETPHVGLWDLFILFGWLL